MFLKTCVLLVVCSLLLPDPVSALAASHFGSMEEHFSCGRKPLNTCECMKRSEDDCPSQYKVVNPKSSMCIATKQECFQCWWLRRLEKDPDFLCQESCKYRFYPSHVDPNDNASVFYCVTECPMGYVGTFLPGKLPNQHFCAFEPKKFTNWILILLSVLLMVLISVTLVLGIKWKREVDNYKRYLKSREPPPVEEPPHEPSNIKPNLSQMKIIRVTEIYKGELIGHGTFTSTFKGIWIPKGQDIKIPVAIKSGGVVKNYLRSQDILEEAYIGSSVQRLPHLLPTFGLCMVADMMLLQPYMPLGTLKNYLLDNRHQIGSKLLMTYCAQVALGMTYMEDRNLLHRNLACRNIYMHTPDNIKIAGFGKPRKISAFTDDQIEDNEDKIPFRWMALESLSEEKFDFKSDVWAFGSTIWEIIMFGVRPFPGLAVLEIPQALQGGERLPRPLYCAPAFYSVIFRCWNEVSSERPLFKDLNESLGKMLEGPKQYLFFEEESFIQPPSYSELFADVKSISTDHHVGMAQGEHESTAEDIPFLDQEGKNLGSSQTVATTNNDNEVSYSSIKFPKDNVSNQNKPETVTKRKVNLGEVATDISYAALSFAGKYPTKSINESSPSSPSSVLNDFTRFAKTENRLKNKEDNAANQNILSQIVPAQNLDEETLHSDGTIESKL